MKASVKKLFAFALIVAGIEAAAETISAKGSDTLVILAQKWAERYMKSNPEVRIQVTGGGSGTGLAALQNQTTHLANASRRIKPKEIAACVKAFRRRPTEYRVCLDGLSVYVHRDNPISELTLGQLADIFTGRVRNWSVLGGPDAPIILYSRENSSGTYEFFKATVLEGRDFAASAQTMPGPATVLQAVAKDKLGIGYGGAAYGQGAKFVRVKRDPSAPAYAPTEDNVVSRKYPIWRYLYIYVNPAQDKGMIANYLNWIRSDAGQSVVREVGYFPLPSESRL